MMQLVFGGAAFSVLWLLIGLCYFLLVHPKPIPERAFKLIFWLILSGIVPAMTMTVFWFLQLAFCGG